MTKDSKAEEAVKAMSKKTTAPKNPPDSDYLSTGVTLLNLANYNRVDGGLLKGHIYRVAGRSSSGKTFLGRTILAEATINPAFDGYELIYDDVERGALMDTAKFFGQRLVDRLVRPKKETSTDSGYSVYISDFYDGVKKKLSAGKKFIWILDSLDSLSPDPGKETKMTDGKAKTNSSELRKLIDGMQETGSILIIVSQVRANFQQPIPGMKFAISEDTISGGRAPEFYSTLDIILQKKSTIKAVYKEKKYNIGHYISARVTKNRLSGLDRTLVFPFYPDFGIDDVGANVDFLISSNHWAKNAGRIQATEFEFELRRQELVIKIEEEKLQKKLKVIVSKVWYEIEEACRLHRRSKYE